MSSIRKKCPPTIDSVAIVHNGIIENYIKLKKELSDKGCKFKSQTGIAHLLTQFLNKGLSPHEAIKETLPKLEGAFALAILFRDHKKLIGARKGSPLALGMQKTFF